MLAYLLRSMTSYIVEGYCCEMRDEWAAATAAALSAAAFWTHGHRKGSAAGHCGSAETSGGGDHGSASGSGSQQQQQQQVQLQCLQHAAFDLGEAATLLLPAAPASLDALEREPMPRLLVSLARHCRMEPDTLQRHMQVLAAATPCNLSQSPVMRCAFLSISPLRMPAVRDCVTLLTRKPVGPMTNS